MTIWSHIAGKDHSQFWRSFCWYAAQCAITGLGLNSQRSVNTCQIYLTCCLPGCSPHFPQIKLNLQLSSCTSFLVDTPSSDNTRWLYTRTSPDGQYQNQIDYVPCSWRWESSIQSAKNKTRRWLWLRSWTPCCQIQTEIEESREKHKTPFRYDVNQISYDYTVEVTNRFKGLDLIDRMPEELWTEVHDIVQEALNKTITSKKEMQKGKMVVWGGLANSWEKKRSERQRKKGKISIWMQSSEE